MVQITGTAFELDFHLWIFFVIGEVLLVHWYHLL